MYDISEQNYQDGVSFRRENLPTAIIVVQIVVTLKTINLYSGMKHTYSGKCQIFSTPLLCRWFNKT